MGLVDIQDDSLFKPKDESQKEIKYRTNLGPEVKPVNVRTYLDFLYNLGGGNTVRFPAQGPYVIPRPPINVIPTANAFLTTEDSFDLTTETGLFLVTNQSYNT